MKTGRHPHLFDALPFFWSQFWSSNEAKAQNLQQVTPCVAGRNPLGLLLVLAPEFFPQYMSRIIWSRVAVAIWVTFFAVFPRKLPLWRLLYRLPFAMLFYLH